MSEQQGKLDKILEILERMEARQITGLSEIKETQPPEMGSFARSELPPDK